MTAKTGLPDSVYAKVTGVATSAERQTLTLSGGEMISARLVFRQRRLPPATQPRQHGIKTQRPAVAILVVIVGLIGRRTYDAAVTLGLARGRAE